MVGRLATLAILVASVVACAPEAAPSGAPALTPTAQPGTSRAPSRPAEPSPTAAAPGSVFRVVSTEPVIPRSALPDSAAVLPAAVAVVDGTFHAWVKGFGNVPGNHRLLHLHSEDAVAWSADPPEPLAFSGLQLADPGVVPGSVVVVDGRWVMYLSGTQGADGRADIWRATADEPGGPWAIEPDPVVVRGPAGAWDGAGLDFTCVIATEDGYLMA